MLILKLKEAQARYNVTNKALAEFIGVGKTLVSDWRAGRRRPSYERINLILGAIAHLGDDEQLKLFPLSISELLEWRDLNESLVTKQNENICS
ncbi:helix-turn-helix domain-containing protein [Leptolyngbyaceae cyanobacterium CCMR0082]|uniref:Helix-turn-helix domain-containing protein n=1 Tax=Adonisia turfae CCMR0082 TaxID=2304604 RepID=A0A6M0RZ75_9CYAN|nr:helix-turn-helix transcriptional regulator [Adonisia turfae]NEZ61203.1 helix-turn-helix domain-containing protein [Adonisia turfae CCMR0082]